MIKPDYYIWNDNLVIGYKKGTVNIILRFIFKKDSRIIIGDLKSIPMKFSIRESVLSSLINYPKIYIYWNIILAMNTKCYYIFWRVILNIKVDQLFILNIYYRAIYINI